jgi:mannose-1-phosphate guanylyltransferase
VTRWAVVLAGGVGSRFWPLSTPERPKQLLPLVSDEPLLVATLARLEPIISAQHTLVLTNRILADPIARIAPQLPPGNILAEPRAGGTAAALTWAAREIERRTGPESTMISVHADWAIGDDNAFRDTLLASERIAIAERALVTVGVVPTRPDPGLGYIEPGRETENGAREVRRFVEKPARERAEWMVHEGYLWNSGIFAWIVGDFLSEVRALTPEVAPALATHSASASDIDAFFNAVTPVSIDVGVLERSKRIRVIPGDFGWDDIGTWASLRRAKPEDSSGNVAAGSVYAVKSRGNVVHAADSTVVLYGVTDLVVVTSNGLTLVTTTESASDLKTLVDSLPPELRQSS